MTTTQRTYPHGLFSWADVAVPDPRAGAQFYSALFGWETDDQFDADGGYMYTMFRKQGDAVAGIGEMPEGMLAAGAPPSWQSYVTVDDLDATTTTVEANGGAVMHVMDLDPVGRMAVVGDPSGAVLMLWEAGNHAGADLFTGHGTMSWNELAARDVAKAQSFYAEVLGWRYEDAPGPFDYQLIMMDTKIDEQPYMFDTFNGGMMLMDDTWPAEMPSHWMVYFTVDNVDDLVGSVAGLGGEVAVPAFDTPNGRIAVIKDSQGAVFSIIAPSQAVAPDEA